MDVNIHDIFAHNKSEGESLKMQVTDRLLCAILHRLRYNNTKLIDPEVQFKYVLLKFRFLMEHHKRVKPLQFYWNFT